MKTNIQVTKSKKEQKPAPNKQDVHTLQTPAGETATLNSKETKKVGESSSGTGKDGPSDEKKTEEGSSNDAASTGERQQSGPDGEKGGGRPRGVQRGGIAHTLSAKDVGPTLSAPPPDVLGCARKCI